MAVTLLLAIKYHALKNTSFESPDCDKFSFMAISDPKEIEIFIG